MRAALAFGILAFLGACGGEASQPDRLGSSAAASGVGADDRPYVVGLPPGWRVLTPWDPESRAEEWAGDQAGELVRIQSFEVPAGRSAEQVVLDIADRSAECTTAPVMPERVTLGGEPALQMSFRCGVTRYSDLVTAHAGFVYIVSVQSGDDLRKLATVAEIFRTFEFVD